MRKILIMVLCIVMIFAFASCSKNAEEQSEQEQDTALATEEPELISEEPEEQQEDQPEEQQDEQQDEGQLPQSREDVMSAILENPQWIAGENADQMTENMGGQFGDIAAKQPGEDGTSFQFITQDDGAYMPLNTRLKDFGGDGRAQQAFNMKFMSQGAGNISFTMIGMGEVVVSFEEEGAFCTYVQSGMKIAFSEYMPTGFMMEDEKWYNILLATDENARLRVIIWEEGNYENQAFYEQDLYIGADDIYESNWKIIIGFDAQGTLNVADYGVFIFDSFTQNPPLAGDLSGDQSNPTISGLGFDQGNYRNEEDGVYINIQSMAWGGAEKDIIYYKLTMYDVEFAVEILYPERQYKIYLEDGKWYLYDPENSEAIEPWLDVEAELTALIGDHADTLSDDLVGFINSYCSNKFGYTPDELIMMNYE